MELKSEKYFNEGKNHKEVVANFKRMCSEATLQIGKDKDCNKYVKGYCLSYFHHYGIFAEPIVYNLDKKTCEFQYAEIMEPKDIEKHIRLKRNPAVNLERFCYVFSDGQTQYEFFYDKDKQYNKETKDELSNQLNEIFFIKPFTQQLELDLDEKQENKKKPKI